MAGDNHTFSSTYDREASDREASLMRMADEIAVEMNDGSIPEDDLQGEAYLGLAIAIKNFGEDASDDILEDGIREYLRTSLENYRETQQSDGELAYQVSELSRTIEDLTKTLGTKPNLDEIANSMGITQEKVLDILKLAGEDIGENVGAI